MSKLGYANRNMWKGPSEAGKGDDWKGTDFEKYRNSPIWDRLGPGKKAYEVVPQSDENSMQPNHEETQ